MIAYFDCFSGISGDMTLGALVDAGLSPDRLRKELLRLPVRGYEIKVRKVKRAGLRSTKVDVKIQDSGFRVQKARTWKDIEKIINKSSLSGAIKKKGLTIFKRLFQAEAKVHGSRYDKVHLHELGAVDCMVDIFGTLIGFDVLGINTVYSSPVNVGSGTIKTEHGILPVPAPATVELLHGRPFYSSETDYELTTPTGAVLISSLAKSFGPVHEMTVSKTGTGAGGWNFKDRPNILRIFIGKEAKGLTRGISSEGQDDEEVTVIETNIDDMNPQIYEYVMEKLFKAGALDVFLTHIIMKKGRPGIKLTALCDNSKKDILIKELLRETTSIGLRFYRVGRATMEREMKAVNTGFGKISTKVSRYGDEIIKAKPEYEDCRQIARKKNVPLRDVLDSVGAMKKGSRAKKKR
jgi:uncharacterized protein (TIGR00299 family) protein